MGVNHITRYTGRLLAATFLSAALVAPAVAQQRGLVNVNVSDIVIQVPIGVAANICGFSVGVIQDARRANQETVCDATPKAVVDNQAASTFADRQGMLDDILALL